jgi:hypothetical protein
VRSINKGSSWYCEIYITVSTFTHENGDNFQDYRAKEEPKKRR